MKRKKTRNEFNWTSLRWQPFQLFFPFLHFIWVVINLNCTEKNLIKSCWFDISLQTLSRKNRSPEVLSPNVVVKSICYSFIPMNFTRNNRVQNNRCKRKNCHDSIEWIFIHSIVCFAYFSFIFSCLISFILICHLQQLTSGANLFPEFFSIRRNFSFLSFWKSFDLISSLSFNSFLFEMM